MSVKSLEAHLNECQQKLDDLLAAGPGDDLEAYFAYEDDLRNRRANAEALLGAAKARSIFKFKHWDGVEEDVLLLETRESIAHVRYADGEEQTMCKNHFWKSLV